jgi:L-lactate dehydrogenase
MKIGIVGSGLVGSTAAFAMIMRGVGREIVLVDRNHDRAAAEADDLFHAVPFASPLEIRCGDYSDLGGADVVVLTAGVNQKPGETRLQLLERNAAVFREIVPATLRYAQDAVFVVATNPVDIMTHLTAQLAADAGIAATRVVGSGTTLDTARFRSLVGRRLQVDSHHVHGYVVGEHGDSEVLTWSLLTVAGLHIEEFLQVRGETWGQDIRDEIDQRVRKAAYQIIRGKGATYYGIGSALARIVEAILNDQRAILTVCAPCDTVGKTKGVTLALPRLVGGGGILQTIPLRLNSDETSALEQSAWLLQETVSQLQTT